MPTRMHIRNIFKFALKMYVFDKEKLSEIPWIWLTKQNNKINHIINLQNWIENQFLLFVLWRKKDYKKIRDKTNL